MSLSISVNSPLLAVNDSEALEEAAADGKSYCINSVEYK